MNCELIAVGTEILLGNILNTHAKFLSETLAAIGIPVYYHTAVGDNPKRLQDVVSLAFSRSDLVIFSGGLGPTTDDITAEVVCRALGLEMEFDPRAWADILDYFQKTGRTPTENNKKQSYFPKNATVFYNAHGTAPGFAVKAGDKTAILLPGPPRELIPMVKDSVLPYLMGDSNLTFHSENLMIIGIGEAALEPMLSDLVVSTDPTVALYAKDGQVQVRVTAAVDRDRPDLTRLQAMLDEIKKRTGICCYGQNIETIQEALVPLLAKKNLKLATAESLTGGMIGQMITCVPGASRVYECGIVSYCDRIKQEVLGVDRADLDQYGAVSATVARQMAVGALRISGADIAVAVTGFAGPATAQDNLPVGTVFVSAAYGKKTVTQQLHIGHGKGNERDYIRKLTAMRALDLVRRMLLQDPQICYDTEIEKETGR